MIKTAQTGREGAERRGANHSSSANAANALRPETRQPSSQPVARPSFKASDWDGEVDELVSQISPSPQGERVVQQLASIVQRELRELLPEVEVMGFASGDLLRGTAFGVAVPEVDIVASANPDLLAVRMQGSRSQGGGAAVARGAAPTCDPRKLQKSTIRACTDRLVSAGGFKFRRSAFRGRDPKVTLLAASSLGIHSEAIPLDLSVNSSTPLYNAALLTECGQLEPRARSLILLVRRWAKDRGICHAAKGHLSPYSWTLLVIYFLQVGAGGPLLPPLEGFRASSGLAVSGAGKQRATWEAPRDGERAEKSVGALFKDFLHFYTSEFDYRNEAVSVRLGRRAAPELSLPLSIIVHEDGQTSEVAPSIENPFETTHNLGEGSTAQSLARLREELARAQELSRSGASLGDVLEPWMPPEQAKEQKDDE